MMKGRAAVHILLAAVPELLIPSGAGAVAYGAWLIHPPSGWIVGGALSIACGVLAARRAGRSSGSGD